MSRPPDQLSAAALLARIRRDSPLAIKDLGELRRAFSEFYLGFAAPDAPRPRPLAGAPVPAWEILAPGADSARTILFFHGGGFTIGSTADHADLCFRLSAASGVRVVGLDYRLAPEHRFPAAVEDAAGAYAWLLETGGGRRAPALAGISAGGNLVLTTLLKAREAGSPLAPAAVCMSPAADLAYPEGRVPGNLVEDWITSDRLEVLRSAYLGGHSVDDPLASPLRADLGGLPPLLIQAGESELLLDSVRELAAKAQADGAPTEFRAWPGMFHCWQVFAGVLEEGRRAIAEAGDFLRRHLA